MADAARARSEARRKKILENAEKRINRLYSRQQEENDNNCEESDSSKTGESPQSQQWQCDKCGNINFGNRKVCLLCRTQQFEAETENSEETASQHEMNKVHEDASKGIEKTDVESSKERPLIISSPNQGELRHRKSHNTVKLQRAEVSQVNTSQEDVVLPQSTNTPRAKKMPYTQNQLFEIYRILGCVLIAFVSRMVLKTGYGLFYFKTIFLPFTAFQIGLYLFKTNFLKGVNLNQRQNMMSTALMLCGLSPHLIQTYSEVMGYVKAVSEDLFFFVFMFFACGLFI
uniref:Uncharacterized protein LOC111117862 n=1 Tax=Crassostrea virginica TaxID=6565 RepID=A0A8B8CAX4_CRAVI|nr:uncharacterized protein LOC111117862 [Crassostrea virginica]